MTNTRLIAAVARHNAKPRKTPPPEPLPAGEVAELVCATAGRSPLPALARRYHRAPARVRRALGPRRDATDAASAAGAQHGRATGRHALSRLRHHPGAGGVQELRGRVCRLLVGGAETGAGVALWDTRGDGTLDRGGETDRERGGRVGRVVREHQEGVA